MGDRYESIDYLDDDEIYNCLMNMQKQDILNVKTENDYWEDIPEELFELACGIIIFLRRSKLKIAIVT